MVRGSYIAAGVWPVVCTMLLRLPLVSSWVFCVGFMVAARVCRVVRMISYVSVVRSLPVGA